MNPSNLSGIGPSRVTRWTGASFAGILLLALPLAAETLSTQALEQIRSLSQWKDSWTPTEQRISSQLLAATRMARGLAITPAVPALASVWQTVRVDALGAVEVDIKADVTPELVASLESMGAQVESSLPQYHAIRARLQLLKVHAAADLPGVQFIRPAATFITNTGPHDSEGDAAHRAPAARALGVNGAGVKVGVLSDGVSSLAARQASGDLPPGVTVVAPGGTDEDEGTAMLEIVYDLAPQAQLYFATGDGGSAAMANNIIALKNAGCRVIIDDLTYLDEGVFQDGVIAQAVKAVTDQGVLYFSSAANSGNKNDGTSGTWEGDFVDSGLNLVVGGVSRGRIHAFAPGQTGDKLSVSANNPLSLKWSDPLGASANDYDLYVVNNAFTTVIDSSIDIQNGTQDPFEIVGPQPPGSQVVVVKRTGSARALHIDTNRGQLAINTQGNTYGHNAAASALTVAATKAANAGGGAFAGGAANPVEDYSSDGPRRLFYNPNGTAITPGNVLFGTGGGTLLQKPDITAADCVVTGFPTTGQGHEFNPFCGTSAAAPHAGAIAALALSMPSAPSPAQVKSAMISTALDIEAVGADRDSGVGIVMADRTFNALQPPVAGTTRFFTLPPCRVVDTRNVNPPALNGGLPRTFFLAGVCGIPTTAKAVSINVTITGPTTAGDLRLFPGGVAAALVSAINFSPGQTRANDAIVQLGGGTTAAITVQNDASGPVDFILDVNGYFQ